MTTFHLLITLVQLLGWFGLDWNSDGFGWLGLDGFGLVGLVDLGKSLIGPVGFCMGGRTTLEREMYRVG